MTHPAAGGLQAETVTTYYRDGVPTPHRTSGHGAYVFGSEFSPYGEPLLIDAGNTEAYMLNYAYEHGTRRLDQSWLVRQGVAGYDMDMAYSYDDAGNVTSVLNSPTAAGAGGTDAQCFEFDGLRRMTQAWTPADADCSDTPAVGGLGGPAPYWLSWTFDEVGNRLTQTDHTARR